MSIEPPLPAPATDGPPDTAAPSPALEAVLSYPAFLRAAVTDAFRGGVLFYAWMTILTAVALTGLHAWGLQVRDGMIATGMSDHVSWGLYIANFTFGVGLAAGGVMMVIPAYLYKDEEMHHVVIVGEILAVAAIVMCLLFVTVDLGRPDRFWHLIPGIGRFHWPISMLTWDVVVLNGYLLLNLHICGYLLYMRFLGQRPAARWYIPFVFLSIGWAISIHTVTAFLYCGLGGRPFWNSALLAPRFLASAFVSGPCFIILALHLVRRLTAFHVGDGALRTLVEIVRVALTINLVMVASEIFTEFYTGSAHVASARYLYFGLHGQSGLVPWTWTATALNLAGWLLFLSPAVAASRARLAAACAMCFFGVWIEKGMGLIVPGFIPSTLHEVVEYAPSLTEWQVAAGIWAAGLMTFTLGVKVATGVMTGRLARPDQTREHRSAMAFTTP